MNSSWLTNPTVLVVGAVGIFAAIILMRNQQSSNTPTTSGTVTSLGNSAATNPVGGSYQYLDGSGFQHIIATDPNGNLVGYNSLPPGTSMPETNQMSSYVGSMSGQYLVAPYGSTTPYYSISPYYNMTSSQ
ncbi:MAG TPA: hypothetical protein VGE97_09700 [Nitrososphaera sp.]|jgi:hypothetical protein